jgi:DNA-binding NarL/FixJ family response regulator
MRGTLRKLITEYGNWDVCGEAIDGQEAIGAALALKPDVVLLDFKMPNCDGLTAASAIRQKLPETHIFMFTLFKSGELESQAKKVGVRAVVSKEEGVVKLLRAIEEDLGLPSSV